MKNKICAVINLRNHLPFGKALESFGWCDVYYTKNAKTATGKAAPDSQIDELKINFKDYDSLLLFQEKTCDVYAAELAKKQNSKIVVFGNQHGYYKSILQIKNRPPKPYDYWIVWGQYWLDRASKILSKVPKKWLNLGSLKHSYYFKTFTWKPTKKVKALVIYEPNTDESYKDPKPETHHQATQEIINALEMLKIPFDIKAHPLWPKLKGNYGDKMWQPPKPMKDFDIKKIINYSAVLGSRSTLLFDAISMGMPVVGFASKSQWEDDEYGPAKKKLFPYTSNPKTLASLIKNTINKKPNYRQKLIKYFLGDLNKNPDQYLKFCQLKSQEKKSPFFRLLSLFK